MPDIVPTETLRSRTGWPVWHPTAAIFFVNGALYGVWATQIPLAKIRLGLDPIVLSTALLMLGAGAVIAMTGSGWLIQRFGTATLIRVSGLIFCAMLPLIPLAPNVEVLGAIVFLFGASGGCMDVAMNADASRVEKEAGRPYMSSFHGMWSLGGFVGAGLSTLLLGVTGGSLQALVMAVFLFALFLWGQRGLGHGRVEPVAGASRSGSLRPTALAVLIGVMAALSFSGEGVVLDWAAIFLREHIGADPVLANAGYSAFAGSMAIMRFFGDAIRRRIEGVTLVRAGCVLAFFGLLLGPLSGNVYVGIFGYALTGVGFSNIVPVLFSAAGALPRPEVQIAAVSTMGYAGLLAAPPLLGGVAHVASLAAIFYVAAAATLIIASLAWACAPGATATRRATEAG